MIAQCSLIAHFLMIAQCSLITHFLMIAQCSLIVRCLSIAHCSLIAGLYFRIPHARTASPGGEAVPVI
jgi:hypothetical protein